MIPIASLKSRQKFSLKTAIIIINDSGDHELAKPYTMDNSGSALGQEIANIIVNISYYEN